MKYSDLDICNLALGMVGSESIDNLAANHKKNRMCALFYSITRDYLLTSFDWSFARKFQTLVAAVDVPASEIPAGLYAYLLPEDCEIPRLLYPRLQRSTWEIFGPNLFTPRNDADLGLYYTREDITSFEFTTSFTQLISVGIAVRLASPIAQDEALSATLYQQFLSEQVNCMAIDANASNNYRAYDEDPNNDSWVHPDLDTYLGPVDSRYGYT